MDSQELADEIKQLLEQHLVRDAPERISLVTLGNAFHVYVDNKEFVLVLRTTEPERRWNKAD